MKIEPGNARSPLLLLQKESQGSEGKKKRDPGEAALCGIAMSAAPSHEIEVCGRRGSVVVGRSKGRRGLLSLVFVF